jgi:hypothetical protein
MIHGCNCILDQGRVLVVALKQSQWPKLGEAKLTTNNVEYNPQGLRDFSHNGLDSY